MPTIDERIRRELREMPAPPGDMRPLEQVRSRRSRYRARRHLSRVALAVIVVAATVAGSFGLVRAFRSTDPGRVAGSEGALSGAGPILFSDVVGSQWDLFTMRPDGSGVARLTSTQGDELIPRWAPGGELVAFVFVGQGREGSGLYVMGADGMGARKIFAPPKDEGQIVDLSWAPDGTEIAFVVEERSGSSLLVLEVRTARSERILEASGIGSVDWSPDGSTLLITRSTPAGSGGGSIPNDLYLIAPDGNDQRRLTEDGVSTYGRWSPDGSRIAFESHDAAEAVSTDVYVMNADGSQRLRLTRDPGMDYSPRWSPDGSRILFVSRRTAEGEDASTCHLFIVRTDGSGLTSIKQDRATTCGADPSWGTPPPPV